MTDTLKSGKRGRPRKFSKREGLEIARTLFSQSGYDLVGIKQLCEALNIPPTSLYAAYGSKANLYQMVIEDLTLDFLTQLHDVLETSNSTGEVFRNILEFTVAEYYRDPTYRGHLIFDGTVFTNAPELKQFVIQQCKKIRLLIKNRLEICGDTNAEELANAIMTFLRGLSSSAKAGESEEDLMVSVEFYCSALDC